MSASYWEVEVVARVKLRFNRTLIEEFVKESAQEQVRVALEDMMCNDSETADILTVEATRHA